MLIEMVACFDLAYHIQETLSELTTLVKFAFSDILIVKGGTETLDELIWLDLRQRSVVNELRRLDKLLLNGSLSPTRLHASSETGR